MISHETQEDEKIQTTEKLAKEDEMKESLQEHKDNEDMEICNNTVNEDMNAGATDDNDEGVKASVDDNNSCVCQNSNDPDELNDEKEIIETLNNKQEDEKHETSEEYGNKEEIEDFFVGRK